MMNADGFSSSKSKAENSLPATTPCPQAKCLHVSFTLDSRLQIELSLNGKLIRLLAV